MMKEAHRRETDNYDVLFLDHLHENQVIDIYNKNGMCLLTDIEMTKEEFYEFKELSNESIDALIKRWKRIRKGSAYGELWESFLRKRK